MKIVAMLAAGASLLLLANPVSAAQVIDFTSSASHSGSGLIFSDGSVNVRASAWSVDYGSRVQSAGLGHYSEGLGVSYGWNDSHTVDNSGNRDFVLLQFDQAVTLDFASFTTGWYSMYDTDAMIGYGNLNLDFTAQPDFDNSYVYSALSDFSFYDSGSAGYSGNSVRNVNPDAFTANSWLIAAGSLNAPDRKTDGFKLKAVSYSMATPPAVPEPATWALMLLGFGVVGAAMRSSKRQTTAVRFA